VEGVTKYGALEFISEFFEDHLGAYNVEFVPKYCCACSKAVRAHSVFVVCPGMSECIIKLDKHNVNLVVCCVRIRRSSSW